MARHIMVVEPDHKYAERFPSRPPQMVFHVECPPGNGCAGWQECYHDHGDPRPGDDASDEVWDAWEDEHWEGAEREFHGEVHTWRDAGGWTTAFDGCVVAGNFDDVPDNMPLPLTEGRFVIEDEWVNDECWLTYISPEGSTDSTKERTDA